MGPHHRQMDQESEQEQSKGTAFDVLVFEEVGIILRGGMCTVTPSSSIFSGN